MREKAVERGNAMADDPEWRLRIAVSVSGDRNPRWCGGASVTPYAPGFSRKLKRQIRERDGYVCQLCGITEDELGRTLTVHHSDYDKSNHDPENLFAVCLACNSRANSNRDHWTGYFAALADLRSRIGKNVLKLIGRKVVVQREGLISTTHDGGPDLRDVFDMR